MIATALPPSPGWPGRRAGRLRSSRRTASYPVTTLLDELEIGRDDLVADLQSFVPPIVEAARAEGRLEQLIRDRVEPFFRSDAVTQILG